MHSNKFRRVATAVERSVSLRHGIATDERDQEWQRVNSYVADVLKDTHVLYAKLARLQGDFTGSELEELESVSDKVLELGEQLSRFMKDFHNGAASMLTSKLFGGGESPPGQSGQPGPTAPPTPEPERTEVDYESEIRAEEDGEFSEFEEVEEEPAKDSDSDDNKKDDDKEEEAA